jgi:hypothetical protein
MFPKMSQKGKNGMFAGPQIQELLQSLQLKNKMSSTERNDWQAFMFVVYGFLGEKGDIYKEIGENLIEQYHFFCRLSMKLYVLHSHW